MQKQALLMLLCCTLSLSATMAQERTQKEREFWVSFRVDSDLLLKDLKSNERELDSLFALLRAQDECQIDSLVFVGSTSPEGGFIYNGKI